MSCGAILRAAVSLLVTSAILACGSTVPTAPSVAPAAAPSAAAAGVQATQYPSWLGYWQGSSGLGFQYHRTVDSTGSSHCEVGFSVRTQTGGMLAGDLGFNGSSLNSDKQCPSGGAFSIVVQPDGTISFFQLGSMLGSHECAATTEVRFIRGTATANGFSIQLGDRANCRFPPTTDDRLPRDTDTDRTFTIVIDRHRTFEATP